MKIFFINGPHIDYYLISFKVKHFIFIYLFYYFINFLLIVRFKVNIIKYFPQLLYYYVSKSTRDLFNIFSFHSLIHHFSEFTPILTSIQFI